MKFSDRQHEVYRAPMDLDVEEIHVVGPKGCGKTEPGLRGFMSWAGHMWADEDFALVCKSSTERESVLRATVSKWAHQNGIPCRLVGNTWAVAAAHGPPNRFHVVLFVDGAKPAERIQGANWKGAYIDEFVNCPAGTVAEIRSRVRGEGPLRIVTTMNPDDPLHPAKAYIDQSVEDGNGVEFNVPMDANPILGPNHITNLHRAYPQEHDKLRHIHGQWASKSGNIWPNATVHYSDKQPEGRVRAWSRMHYPAVRWLVSGDYGRSSPSHFLLWAVTSMGLWVVDEWRYDGSADGELSEHQQAAKVFAWATTDDRSVHTWIVDMTASAMLLALQQTVHGEVLPSNCTIEDSINWAAAGFNNGRLWIDPRCVHLRREAGAYRWKRSDDGNVKPDKKAAGGAHGCDALRYGAYNFQGEM